MPSLLALSIHLSNIGLSIPAKMYTPNPKLHLLLPLLCSSITLTHTLNTRTPEPNTISNEILPYPGSSIRVTKLDAPGRPLNRTNLISTYIMPIWYLSFYANDEPLPFKIDAFQAFREGGGYHSIYFPTTTTPTSSNNGNITKQDWLVTNYELLDSIIHNRIPVQEMGANISRGEEGKIAEYAVADLDNPDRKPGVPGGQVSVTGGNTNTTRSLGVLTPDEQTNNRRFVNQSSTTNSPVGGEWWSWVVEFGPNSMSPDAAALQITEMAVKLSLLPAGTFLKGNGSEGSIVNDRRKADGTSLTLVNMHTADGDPGIRVDGDHVEESIFGFWQAWIANGTMNEVTMTFCRSFNPGENPYIKIVLKNETVVAAKEKEPGFVKVN